MLYSFIIPVYNCKPYLASCVNSILAADLSSYEIILVDDGSQDGSSQLCDLLSLQHPQIKVIHQKNSGASSARNTGLSHAQGDMLLFLDSDDTLDSVELREILTDTRCIDSDFVIFGLRFDYYRKGNCYRRDCVFFNYDGILSDIEWSAALLELFSNNSLSSSCTKIYRRSIIEENNLQLNTSMFLYEDLEFVLRYLSCCKNIWNVPKAVYHYRQTEDEGNAGRRLARIDCIPDFLIPIENALNHLQKTHPSIGQDQCEHILQSLHLTLAREKIGVSSPSVIHKVCRDYASWEHARLSSPAPSRFRTQLLNERVLQLWIHHKLTSVRHRIAVIVKSTLHLFRKEANDHV